MISVKLTRKSKVALAIAALFALGLGVNWLTTPPSGFTSGPAIPGVFQPQIEQTFIPLSSIKSVAENLAATTTTLPSTAGQTFSSLTNGRMEIFSASIAVEVKDVKAALTQIASLAEQFGGFVAGSSASAFSENEVATIIIKVPKDNFFQAVNAVRALGKVKNLETRSDDVTEEFIDLKARRDNLQKEEQRLQDILKLGNTVDDVLKVERELERVRGEIESLTGRINFLERNVEMSSVMVTLSKPTAEKAPEFDWTEPFRTGLAFLYSVVRGLMITAFIIAPFAVIGTPAYAAYRYRRSKTAKAEALATSKSV